MTARIFLKLLAGVFCLLLLALLSADYFTSQVAKNTYVGNLVGQLTRQCRMLALSGAEIESQGQPRVRALAAAAGARLTLIRPDGRVIVDSEADAATMENHRHRPELIQAFQGKVGSSTRLSPTMGIDFLYVAVPYSGGALRLAMPLSHINSQVREIRTKILVSTALAFLPAILVAAWVARWLSRRFGVIMAHAEQLANGNFRARLADTTGSEFGRLAHTLNDTAQNLQRTVEQLQHEHSELERLERIRKDFVINVSHELRTPLASIQGYTETLIDGAIHEPEHNMRFLGIIRHNAERLARLTEDLLTLSRIEQKRQKLEFEPHSVQALLQESVEMMLPMSQKRSIQLQVDPVPAPAEVWCDNEAVSQIFSNLLDNAIKYTPVGGSIHVGALPGEHFVEFYVRDTGQGIPPEDLPRLFERFYRVDKARSRDLGGTGLGLSIVKHLVASHTGSVRVESRPNQGSTFFFTLPAEEPLVPAAPPVSQPLA